MVQILLTFRRIFPGIASLPLVDRPRTRPPPRESYQNPIEPWMVGMTAQRPAARRSRRNEADAANPISLIPLRFEDDSLRPRRLLSDARQEDRCICLRTARNWF